MATSAFRNGMCVAALSAGVFVSADAFGSFLVTENFNTNSDTRWEGLNNRAAPNNYGFSATDNTGNSVSPPTGSPTAGGEMGGMIGRVASPANFYGFNVGTIGMNEAFEASGVIHFVSGGGGRGIYLGYFAGEPSFATGGDVRSFAGGFWNDGFETYAYLGNNLGGRERAANSAANLVANQTLPFSISYDPTDRGTLTVNVNGQSVSATNQWNQFADFDPFTHFGIIGLSAAGGATEIYFDDLTFSSENPVPEPASLGLIGLAGLACLRRRRH